MAFNSNRKTYTKEKRQVNQRGIGNKMSMGKNFHWQKRLNLAIGTFQRNFKEQTVGLP